MSSDPDRHRGPARDGRARRRGAARRGRRRPARARSSSTIPKGVSLELCERVTKLLAEVRERYALEVSSPGAERPLTKPEHFRRFLGRRARVRTRGDQRRPPQLHRRARRRHRRRGHGRRRHRRGRRSPTPTSSDPTSWGTESSMSQEIVDAVRALAREKGISEEKLITRARGRAAVGLQEAARRRALRPRATWTPRPATSASRS